MKLMEEISKLVNQHLNHTSTYHHEYELDREDEDICVKIKEWSNPNLDGNGHADMFSEELLKEIFRPLLPLWNKFQAESFDRYIITNTLDSIHENAANNFILIMRRKVFSNLQVF